MRKYRYVYINMKRVYINTYNIILIYTLDTSDINI